MSKLLKKYVEDFLKQNADIEGISYRQDKELESRYQTLEKESAQLTIMLVVVVIGIIVLISLLWIWNRHWRPGFRTIRGGTCSSTLDPSGGATPEICFSQGSKGKPWAPSAYSYLLQHLCGVHRGILLWSQHSDG